MYIWGSRNTMSWRNEISWSIHHPVSLSNVPWIAKRSFYGAVNGIFGRLGRTASEKVILELIKSKCLPIHGLEACPLNKTNLRSLDFSVNRFFMKLFNTCDADNYWMSINIRFYRAAWNADAVYAMRIPSVRLSVRPSVRHTRELWQNGRKICPDLYTIWKNI